MSSWADSMTETLHALRANLLAGLDKVATHIEAGTLDTIQPGKASSPRDSGHLTLMLLDGIDPELAERNSSLNRNALAVSAAALTLAALAACSSGKPATPTYVVSVAPSPRRRRGPRGRRQR